VKVDYPRDGASQTGIASWYGDPYNGRRTASGEVFDMEKMTAAHRAWPFGTIVGVRNLDNGKYVRVKINDRGPFVRGRIIDLSRGAAREAGMLGAGLAKVKLTVISAPAAPPRTRNRKRQR
jgi:rare lipoprotein A